MFNFSFGELLVIGAIALLVLGPDKLPGAARTAGMWIGKIRRTMTDLQNEVTAQFEAEELRKELKDTQSKLDIGLSRLRQSINQSDRDIRDSLKKVDTGLQHPAEQPASPTADVDLSSAPKTPTEPSVHTERRFTPPPAPPEVRAAPSPPPRPSQRPVIARHVLHAPIEELIPPLRAGDSEQQPLRKE